MAKKQAKKSRSIKAQARAKSSAANPSRRAPAVRYVSISDLSASSGISKATLRRFAKSPAIRSHVIVEGTDVLFPWRAFQTSNFTSVDLPRKPSRSSSIIVTSGSSAADIRSSLGINSSEVEAAIEAILKSSS